MEGLAIRKWGAAPRFNREKNKRGQEILGAKFDRMTSLVLKGKKKKREDIGSRGESGAIVGEDASHQGENFQNQKRRESNEPRGKNMRERSRYFKRRGYRMGRVLKGLRKNCRSRNSFRGTRGCNPLTR